MVYLVASPALFHYQPVLEIMHSRLGKQTHSPSAPLPTSSSFSESSSLFTILSSFLLSFFTSFLLHTLLSWYDEAGILLCSEHNTDVRKPLGPRGFRKKYPVKTSKALGFLLCHAHLVNLRTLFGKKASGGEVFPRNLATNFSC